jgi:hypothetical protein
MSKSRASRPVHKPNPSAFDLEIQSTKPRISTTSEPEPDWESLAKQLQHKLAAVETWLANLPFDQLPDHSILLAGEQLLQLEAILKRDS